MALLLLVLPLIVLAILTKILPPWETPGKRVLGEAVS
jgi:hypothetical protein